jgi:hypothetical protein
LSHQWIDLSLSLALLVMLKNSVLKITGQGNYGPDPESNNGPCLFFCGWWGFFSVEQIYS